MLSFQAFNPLGTALAQSGRMLAARDHSTLVRMSDELTSFYRGNQLFYLHNHIDSVFSDPELKKLYRRFATFYNVVSFVVDRVTILGKRPIAVTFTGPDGTPNEADNEVWRHITENEIEAGWDAFIQALGVYTELCKTSVAVPYWDKDEGRLCLNFYSPHTIDVCQTDPNKSPLRPNGYRMLVDASRNRWQVWDFEDPANAQTYITEGETDSVVSGTRQPIETKDPRSNLALNPFVPFRTALARETYFVDDGQEQLLIAQQHVNRLWTQLAVLMHHGAFKVPIISGEWASKESGGIVRLSMDPSVAIREPNSGNDPTKGKAQPGIRWDGPANEAMISRHLEVIAQSVESLVSTFHIAPDSVATSADARSGVSLYVSSAALKEKQESSIALHRPALVHLVEKIRIIWNTYAASAGQKLLSPDSTINVRVPDQPIHLDPKSESELDALNVANRFVLLDEIIKRRNPGITPEGIAAIKAQKGMTPEVPKPNLNLFRTSASGGSNG